MRNAKSERSTSICPARCLSRCVVAIFAAVDRPTSDTEHRSMSAASSRRRRHLTATATTSIAIVTIAVALIQLALPAGASSPLLCSERARLVSGAQRYEPVAHCRRSNKTQLAAANYRRVAQCARLARDRRALAFNYATVRRRRGGVRNLYDQSDVNGACVRAKRGVENCGCGFGGA